MERKKAEHNNSWHRSRGGIMKDITYLNLNIKMFRLSHFQVNICKHLFTENSDFKGARSHERHFMSKSSMLPTIKVFHFNEDSCYESLINLHSQRVKEQFI